MDPGTAAVLLSATAAATAGAGAVMSYQGQKAQAESESAIAEYNANIAEGEAKEAEQSAVYESMQNRRKTRQILASQKAAIGQTGAVISGSPLLALADTEKQLELDNVMAARNSVLGTNRFRQQSSLFNYQSKAVKKYGNAQATGSLLAGAGQAAGYGANAYSVKAKA
jgi:hypothetical protein